MQAMLARGRSFLNGAATGSVLDKITVDGHVYAEGPRVSTGCVEGNNATSFEVCGCNLKVVAYLFHRCAPYTPHDVTVGSCDCGKGGACDAKSLISGTSEPFEWGAASFSVSMC